MYDKEDPDVPIGYMLVDVDTPEARANVLLGEVKSSADHHDTLAKSMACALQQVLVNFIAHLLSDRDEHATQIGWDVALMMAEAMVNAAEINLYSVLLLGEMGQLIQTHRENGELPKEYYALFPDEIEAG